MDLWYSFWFLLVDLTLTSGFLWLGMRLSGVVAGVGLSHRYCSAGALIQVAAISTLFNLIPYLGWGLSWVALMFLLWRRLSVSFPELLVMVMVAKMSTFILIQLLFSELTTVFF